MVGDVSGKSIVDVLLLEIRVEEFSTFFIGFDDGNVVRSETGSWVAEKLCEVVVGNVGFESVVSFSGLVMLELADDVLDVVVSESVDSVDMLLKGLSQSVSLFTATDGVEIVSLFDLLVVDSSSRFVLYVAGPRVEAVDFSMTLFSSLFDGVVVKMLVGLVDVFSRLSVEDFVSIS